MLHLLISLIIHNILICWDAQGLLTDHRATRTYDVFFFFFGSGAAFQKVTLMMSSGCCDLCELRAGLINYGVLPQLWHVFDNLTILLLFVILDAEFVVNVVFFLSWGLKVCNVINQTTYSEVLATGLSWDNTHRPGQCFQFNNKHFGFILYIT